MRYFTMKMSFEKMKDKLLQIMDHLIVLIWGWI